MDSSSNVIQLFKLNILRLNHFQLCCTVAEITHLCLSPSYAVQLLKLTALS
jgi:hypothetical protein